MEKLSKDTNALNWFEIPAVDIGRAQKFYEAVFQIQMESAEMMGMHMAFFPAENGNGKVSGALVKSDMHKPSTDGAVIYLNANPNIQEVVDRVQAAGGQVIMPKTHIGDDIGYMAFFLDSEGNRMALHAGD